VADHAGIVDQQIDVVGLLGRSLHLGSIRDVEPKRHNPPFARAHELGERLGFASSRVDPSHSPRKQRLHDGPPDSPIRTRNQSHPSLNLQSRRRHWSLLDCD
jgi:hypothetical protein